MIALHIEDWIKKYETKTGDAFERKASFELLYIPERGFAEIKVGDSALFVWQLCGDGRWWFKTLMDTAKRLRLKYLTALVVRKVEPFIRIFGYRVKSIIEAANGTKRYCGADSSGRKVTATTALNEDGSYAHAIITWEVTQ